MQFENAENFCGAVISTLKLLFEPTFFTYVLHDFLFHFWVNHL